MMACRHAVKLTPGYFALQCLAKKLPFADHHQAAGAAAHKHATEPPRREGGRACGPVVRTHPHIGSNLSKFVFLTSGEEKRFLQRVIQSASLCSLFVHWQRLCAWWPACVQTCGSFAAAQALILAHWYARCFTCLQLQALLHQGELVSTSA